MAKSKSGGTRTYLRGRVGSDVYSIGRDSKGKKQQVVRSLAESVSNPQTSAQMRGRMILSTIAQALAVLRPIVDHSFDNVIGAQANLSEFTSRNYGLIKADIAAHPTSGNAFGLVGYKEKGAKQGQYVVAAGQAALPTAMQINKATGVITLGAPADNITIGGLKSALGLSDEEYFTLVGITTSGEANYERFRINPNLADSTAITSANVADVFAVEGNALATIALASNLITITLAAVAGDCTVIISKKVSGKFIHNDAVLGDGSGFDAPADSVLPTYPVGNENFLNGGDIFGMQESVNGAQENTPVNPSEPAADPTLTISKTGNGSATVTANGNTISSGATIAAGTVVSIDVVPESGKEVTANIGGTAISLSQADGHYTGTFNMPSASRTLYINTAYTASGGDSGDGLDGD